MLTIVLRRPIVLIIPFIRPVAVIAFGAAVTEARVPSPSCWKAGRTTSLFAQHPGIDSPDLRAISNHGDDNVAADRPGGDSHADRCPYSQADPSARHSVDR